MTSAEPMETRAAAGASAGTSGKEPAAKTAAAPQKAPTAAKKPTFTPRSSASVSLKAVPKATQGAGGAAAAAPAPAATPDKKAAIEAPEAKPLLVGATTRLTLRVPADAKVWIEGQLTDSTGELREFGTKALADGQAWENYEVRVATVVDGREVETVRRLTLKGGSDLDVAIDPKAASPAIQATASVE